jgi:uncharacterized DUF497 family protein
MDEPNVYTIVRRFEFDPVKDAVNRRKHGCSFADALALDWPSLAVIEDRRMDYGERRWRGMGDIGERLHCVVFTVRNDAIRIISLRRANRREIEAHHEATQQGKPDGSGEAPNPA